MLASHFSALSRWWPSSLRWQAKLSHRLGGGFGLLLVLMVLTIGLALFQMNRMQQQMRSIVESNVERLVAAQSMMDAVNSVSMSTLGFALANDAEDIKAQRQDIEDRLSAYEATQRRFESFGLTGDASVLTPEVRERLKQSVRETRILSDGVVTSALSSGNAPAALQSLNPVNVQQLWVKDIQALVSHEQALCKESYQAARAAFIKTRRVLVGVTLAALLIGTLTAFAILRSVTRPINQAIDHARRISQGDLTGEVDVRGSDEMSALMRMLSDMQGHLRRMISQVRDASEHIRSATGDISAGGRDLSERTEQTASNLQETAASMERLASLVNHGAQAGHQAKQWVTNATGVAAKGGAVMGRVVATMEEIDQSSRRIGQIVAVIDGIAFQTNILALNAAVEAARAGEQGRGFAVVASEVRNLAGRSAEAAREIKSLITSSVERVASGSDLVRQAGTTMNEIVSAVERVHCTIDDMSATLQDQRQGMGEISAAVLHVDRMTQQNAALAEESAATTMILEGQSARLYEAIEAFRA